MPPPPAVLLHSGYTVLCSAADGSIRTGREGLFDFDTRLLSRYVLRLGDEEPELVSSDQPESDRWEAVLRVPRPGGAADGPVLPQDAVEVALHRRVGPVLLEALTVRNHSAVAFASRLRLTLATDFVDVAEAGRPTRRRGDVRRDWADGALIFRCSASRGTRRLERGLRVRVFASSSEPAATEDGLVFDVDLAAGAEWSATLLYESQVDGGWRTPRPGTDGRARQRAAWRSRRPRLDCPDRLRETFDRAADDLFDLRNWELEERYLGRTDGSGWVLNAGVPTFTGFFGRDTLTAGWQSALVGPRASRGALEVAAATQAREDDPWRDAEPGKMIHEMRRGPLSELGLTPRDCYYGTQTTPAMFVLALTELWHWTADTEMLRRHRGAALAGLAWAERYGDADGDGFLEYLRRSPKGLRNQGWKDSDEAIRHDDGRLADGPIATVEEQAFHYMALQRMAEILVVLGEDERADVFLRRAAELRRRWHDAFWMPDEAFYALALDRDKRHVRSITSNPGHALASGIVPPEHAAAVADRLLSPELFSGWGVRTLSSHHPSFNPFAYHLGTVWPVEQATFALGFKRYGLDGHADRLIAAVLEAAERCPQRRLPEALGGHRRGEPSHPVLYPSANSPQAWSASAVVQLVQVMLGIYPFAPLGALALVRPRLPDWLPEVVVRDLRVGTTRLDVRFSRTADGGADHRIERRRGPAIALRAGPPQAPDGGLDWSERAGRAALERLPGRRARAALIALGLA